MSRSSKRESVVPKDDEPPNPDSGAGEWVVACRRCGRQLVADKAAVNEFLAAVWPGCCGAEMETWIQRAGD